MKILKNNNGNVMLIDSDGNVVKTFPPGWSIQRSTDGRVIISDSTSYPLSPADIDEIEVDGNTLPFSGDVNDLMQQLNSIFIPTGDASAAYQLAGNNLLVGILDALDGLVSLVRPTNAQIYTIKFESTSGATSPSDAFADYQTWIANNPAQRIVNVCTSSHNATDAFVIIVTYR